MGYYSPITGLWKSLKNTIIILGPAIAAGWAAFSVNAPPEYQGVISAMGGFVAYFAKNWFQNKD